MLASKKLKIMFLLEIDPNRAPYLFHTPSPYIRFASYNYVLKYGEVATDHILYTLDPEKRGE